MNKENLIRLTNNLYHLTLLFPKKEPLRYKMRELAAEILARCLIPGIKLNSQEGLLENLEILDGFFEVAKNQNWVSPVELLRIQEEYNRIKAEIKKIARRPLESTGSRPLPVSNINGVKPRMVEMDGIRSPMSWRQEKILEILKEKGQVQVWQMKEIFPEVSKRTLRRDFENLLKQGKIERIGEKNETFYQLKRSLAPSR